MMPNNSRTVVTLMIWASIAVALFGLFLSGGMAGGLTVIHLAIAIVLIGAVVGMTGFLWRSSNFEASDLQEQYNEKAKRDRIESVLRNLSNDELTALKKRLSTGAIDDDVLYDYLGDDGELVDYSKR
jgi:hypothetical protein